MKEILIWNHYLMIHFSIYLIVVIVLAMELIQLKVYNILGKEVANLVSDNLNQGNHIYQYNGSGLASGIYYYQLVAGEYREVKKMILLR